MAVQGTLCAPYTQGALNLVDAIPQGGLCQPYSLDVPPSGIEGVLAQRFPVPPSAFGFLTSLNELYENIIPVGPGIGLKAPHMITGAVLPEGAYLEPTIGQIWPR